MADEALPPEVAEAQARDATRLEVATSGGAEPGVESSSEQPDASDTLAAVRAALAAATATSHEEAPLRLMPRLDRSLVASGPAALLIWWLIGDVWLDLPVELRHQLGRHRDLDVHLAVGRP